MKGEGRVKGGVGEVGGGIEEEVGGFIVRVGGEEDGRGVVVGGDVGMGVMGGERWGGG